MREKNRLWAFGGGGGVCATFHLGHLLGSKPHVIISLKRFVATFGIEITLDYLPKMCKTYTIL